MTISTVIVIIVVVLVLAGLGVGMYFAMRPRQPARPAFQPQPLYSRPSFPSGLGGWDVYITPEHQTEMEDHHVMMEHI